MPAATFELLVAMIAYMAVVIGIGLFFARRAQASSENYFLGGRSLGPWVAAMSAEASDMSGWLLMGLPGLAYWAGIADAAWTAVGLAVGTYVNWLLVARRLRRYSAVSGDAITVPDFLSNRFHEQQAGRRVILVISAVFILVFFTVYAGSCFVTVGKLFSTLFHLPYHSMMIAGALFVVVYTFIGGFLAESASDFMQGTVMFVALISILTLGTVAAGGLGAIVSNAEQIPGFFSFFTTAVPSVGTDGVQRAVAGVPQFGAAEGYGALAIVSTLSWGLGYFGVPQVLLRFMAIRREDELVKSRRIATVWCAISLVAAVAIGIIGRVLFPADPTLATASGAESVFVVLAQHLLPTLLAGVIMAGILAATISSSDSYLLIAASAFSKNIYEGVLKRGRADDRQVMRVSRIVLPLVALIGVAIAWDEHSIIFSLVAFAWAGFGATFGPVMLCSLFWRRATRAGAIAGMVAGGVSVFAWRLLVAPLGGVFGIYELLPAFVVSLAVIVAVSLLTPAPSKEICEEFDRAAR